MKSGNSDLAKGFFAGVPIMIGYFFVAIGVGVYAGKNGMTPFQATLMSAANLTSAGEISAISVFGDGGDYLQLVVAQIVINIRYALMAISLSQKRFSMDFNRRCRFLAAYGITDEIFAVASSQPGKVGKYYLYGLMLTPWIGWSLGTFLGAAAGTLLPEFVRTALGIAIYGMFLAIILPPARKSRPVRFVVLAAVALSLCFHYIPGLNTVSSGFVIIICGVAAAALGAWRYPAEEDAA